MKSKIKRLRCGNHVAKDRSLASYIFYFESRDGLLFYKCAACKLEEAIIDERDTRIMANEKKQREDADAISLLKHNERYAYREKSQREGIWDYEVHANLIRGMLNKHLIKFPKELLQYKRALMKLDRLIISKKKEIADRNKEIRQDEIKRIEELNRPLVRCITHGQLFADKVIKAGKSKWTGIQQYKCRECMSNAHRNHYEKNKENVLIKTKNYRINNPKKIKEIRRIYKEKLNAKDKKYATIETDSSSSN